MSFLIHPNNDITTIPYLLPDWNACCSPTTHGKSFYYRAMSLQNFCYVNLKRSHISCVEWKSHGNLSYPTEQLMRYFFGYHIFILKKSYLQYRYTTKYCALNELQITSMALVKGLFLDFRMPSVPWSVNLVHKICESRKQMVLGL